MNNMTFLFFLGLAAAIGGWAVVQIVFALAGAKRERLQQRLTGKRTSTTSDAAQQVQRSVIKPAEAKHDGRLDRVLHSLGRKVGRAYPGMSVGRFLTIVAGIGLCAAAFMALLSGSVVAGFLSGALAGSVPLLVVNSRSAKVQKLFDDQLPDALDFLSRVLRAGHSLATGLQMSADELPDPLAGEFRRCYDEHSLGQPLEDVLRAMAVRIDVPDVSFFVTAVLIQRQTGGDLAEVLRNISDMVRSRIRLQQHVKAITAQGRLTGAILLALPIVFFCVLYVLNPKYAGVLLNTSEGRWVLLTAASMQAMGVMMIRRIVTVKM